VLVIGCAAAPGDEIEPFIDSTKEDGHAPKLRKISDHNLDVSEPSDLAFAGDDLFAVSDAHSKIYEISRKGRRKSDIDITGHDLEALAFDITTGEFLVADESKSRVWHIASDGERHDPIEIVADDGNSGIEGLAFDGDGHLWIAKEKDPARIFELVDGVEVSRTKITFAADLSALSWRSEDGRLYALSDEDEALFQLDADLDVEHAWRLPIDKPEGLAFEGSRVYVASDSEQQLYVFELADD
jgi:uncharacterized protein YjiK